MLFSENDPSSFGNLQNTLLSLFRLMTQDTWSGSMYVSMFGCTRWFYTLGRSFPSKAINKHDNSNCNHPNGLGWIAAAYYITFEILCSFLVLSIFIGIVCAAMEEQKDMQRTETEVEERIERHLSALKVDYSPKTMVLLWELFALLAKDETTIAKVQRDKVRHDFWS